MTATHQISTTLRGQCDKAGDGPHSAPEDQPRVDSEEQSSPEGSVPLHRFCNRCQRMFDAWTEVYAWLDEVQSPEKRDFEPAGKEIEPCTLADLAKNRTSCHFCEIVYSGIEDVDARLPQTLITFRFRDSRNWEALIYVDVTLECDPESLQMICIKSFTYNVFDAPFMAQHIPRQPKDNLVQIREWLGACRSKHDKCSSWCSRLGMKGRRPTRALELSDNAVRLRCDLHAIDGFEYLALSHVWGTDPKQQPRLTTSKLEEFQKNILPDMLPDIFTEAIQLTRYLGFKYLWIDALCIIQDSESDWTAEANMMSAVYNNAICTIAALFPPQVPFTSTQYRGDPRKLTPCIVLKPTPGKAGSCVFPWEFLKSSALTRKDWPLSSRAWTLQEHILSPRTIFYGHRTLIWECAEIYCDELAGTIGDHMAANLDCMTLKDLVSTRPIDDPSETAHTSMEAKTFSDTLWRWIVLIQEYRRRDLTQASDRAMAFSGIAQAFQAEHGLTYLAGIWKEHLPRSLLWHIYNPEHSLERISPIPWEPPLKFAPTWSLFSGPIYSSRDSELYQDLSLLADRILYSARLVQFRWSTAPVDYLPPTAFHDFEGLQITLELVRIDVSFSLRDPRPENHLFKVRCQSTEVRLASFFRVKEEFVKIWCHFDDWRHFEQPPTGVHIALIEEGWASDRREYCFQGLFIEPGGEEETWKRVGYCEGNVWPDSSRASELDLSSDAEEIAPRTGFPGSDEESIFLRIEGAELETLTLV